MFTLAGTSSFVHEKNSLRIFIGHECKYLHAMPDFLKKLRESGYHTRFVTMAKEEMIDIAVSNEAKRIDQFNEHQPKYLSKLVFEEEKVRTVLEDKMEDGTEFAYAVMFSPKVSCDMFAYLFLVFQTDTAHCCNT